MGGDRPVYIVTPRVHLQADPGQFELMRLKHHDLMPVKTLLYRDRLELRTALVGGLVDLLAEAVLGEQLLQAFRSRGDIGRVFGHHHGIEGWAGIDEGAMARVENETPECGQTLQADTIAIGQFGQLVMLDKLQIVEPQRGAAEHRHYYSGEHHDARFEPWCGLGLAAAVESGHVMTVRLAGY